MAKTAVEEQVELDLELVDAMLAEHQEKIEQLDGELQEERRATSYLFKHGLNSERLVSKPVNFRWPQLRPDLTDDTDQGPA